MMTTGVSDAAMVRTRMYLKQQQNLVLNSTGWAISDIPRMAIFLLM